MDIPYFAEQTVNALSLGGTYALLALGLAVVYSVLGLINFAHGALMTLTGYVLFFAAAAGVPFFAGALIAVLAVMLCAILLERIAFRPVRGASGATQLLTGFAIAILMQLAFQLFISTRPKVVPMPPLLTSIINLGGIPIGVNRLLSIVVAGFVLLALTMFLKRTMTGLAMRAAADDFDVTRLMGIRANRVISAAFGLSGILAAIAAILWIAQRSSVDPLMGMIPVLKAFIATTLGGLGNLAGAVVGGFVLGAVEIYLAAYLPDAALPYHGAITLAAVITILVVRPKGILGAKKGH